MKEKLNDILDEHHKKYGYINKPDLIDSILTRFNVTEKEHAYIYVCPKCIGATDDYTKPFHFPFCKNTMLKIFKEVTK
jgi:hypothetical protein